MTRVAVLGSCPQALVRFRQHLLRAMVHRGHQVFACAPGEHEEVTSQLAEMGVQYHPVRLNRTSLNAAHDVATLSNLTRTFRALSPTVVFSYTIKPVIYGSLAAHFAGVPQIYSMITGLGFAFSGSGAKHKVANFGASVLYRLALKFNTKVIFQNPDDLVLFRDRSLLPPQTPALVVNGSGVDTKRFVPAPFPDKPVFLLLARLIRDKGIYEYVAAARQIKKRHPDARFALAGFIDKRPSAINPEELAQWQKEGTIDYLGHLSEVRSALADSSVYVLPSYREGLPLSVLEAMAMGRPIITTDVPGCRETVVQGENGFLVPPRSPQALADAMEEFILNPEAARQLGQASRRLAEQRFDSQKVNRQILEAMSLT